MFNHLRDGSLRVEGRFSYPNVRCHRPGKVSQYYRFRIRRASRRSLCLSLLRKSGSYTPHNPSRSIFHPRMRIPGKQGRLSPFSREAPYQR